MLPTFAYTLSIPAQPMPNGLMPDAGAKGKSVVSCMVIRAERGGGARSVDAG